MLCFKGARDYKDLPGGLHSVEWTGKASTDFCAYHLVNQQRLGQALANTQTHQSRCLSHTQSMAVDEDSIRFLEF